MLSCLDFPFMWKSQKGVDGRDKTLYSTKRITDNTIPKKDLSHAHIHACISNQLPLHMYCTRLYIEGDKNGYTRNHTTNSVSTSQ